MKKTLLLTILYLAFAFTTHAQVVNKTRFFENDTLLDAKLSVDITKLIHDCTKPEYMPATFNCILNDSEVNEQVRVIARGNVRRKICNIPPIKINFHNATSPKLNPLGTLKLVYTCSENDYCDQLLLKEYLIYKIYNLLTDKSFRVRLLNFTYEDAKDKRKPTTQHAFLIEDEKTMAKRNECIELKKLKLHSEGTNIDQMTLVSMFEYMIGNTDWGVLANHNTMLIQSSKDSTSRPYVVPYDFDYSGFVNANYAVPADGLMINNVRQRFYLGYPRTVEQLGYAIDIFNNQKDSIYALVNNFDLLTSKNKRDIISYIDDFYKTINNKKQVKNVFVNCARRL